MPLSSIIFRSSQVAFHPATIRLPNLSYHTAARVFSLASARRLLLLVFLRATYTKSKTDTWLLNFSKKASVMVGFEPRISGVRDNCSFHCTTTEALWRYLSLCCGLGGVGLEGGRVISGQRGPRFDSGYLQTLPSKPAILNFVRKELWIKITRAMLLWRFNKPNLGPNKHNNLNRWHQMLGAGVVLWQSVRRHTYSPRLQINWPVLLFSCWATNNIISRFEFCIIVARHATC